MGEGEAKSSKPNPDYVCSKIQVVLNHLISTSSGSNFSTFAAKSRIFHSGIEVSDLRKNLNIVNSTSEEVRGSEKLRRIMHTILQLGNALNQGTTRGSAVGFRLDSLLKLTDTRATNTKMTLMHYLCKVLVEKLPDLLDFHKDHQNLEASTKFSSSAHQEMILFRRIAIFNSLTLFYFTYTKACTTFG